MHTPLIYKHIVLLVDDYPAGMMVSTMMIEYLGYAVEAVSSGGEAVEKVRASTRPYMAILMDINLPDMDGIETTKIIRSLEEERNYRNTIIAVTAYALAGDHRRCLEAGMDDYIAKPIHPDILAHKLAEIAKRLDI